MERADYEDRYNKQQDNYNRNIDMADRQFNRWVNTEQHQQNMEVGDLQKQMLEVDNQYYPREKEVAYQSGVKQNKLLDKEIDWYDPKAQADINMANAQVQNYNANVAATEQETAAHYAEINTAYNFLNENNFVDANGNCTVMYGGEERQMSSSEVAAGLAYEFIDYDDETGKLIYVGG